MNNSARIHAAVIPAAGLGTRFLPITKVVPKEMLPIAGKPLIQYAVEEAAASGLEVVILVLGRGKRSLAEYFQPDPHLDTLLLRRGRDAAIESLKALTRKVDIRTVWQDAPHGLAHAIACARGQVGDNPFVVILPDALIDSSIPCARQLMDCYDSHPGCVIATREVDLAEVERFGIVDLIPISDHRNSGRVLGVVSLSEKPNPRYVRSRHGIFGRYVLEPAIFSCVSELRPGFAGELQLTDALTACSRDVPIYGYCFDGIHYDAGDNFGFVQASIDYALKEPTLRERLRRHLANHDLAPAIATR